MNFRNYTVYPHPPGLAQNKLLGEQIASEWEKHMDKIETFKYNIYLSYPTAPAEILLHQDDDNNFNEMNLVINREPQYDESEKNNDMLLYPFNAFSASGNITVSAISI